MEILKIVIIAILLFSNKLAAEDFILRLPFFIDKSKCSTDKKFIYLSKDQKQKIQKKFRTDFNQQIIRHYRIKCHKNFSDVFILSDRIRTKPQTLLIEVKNQKIAYAETVKFKECSKFKTPKQWFQKQAVGQNLNSIDSVDGISGATLTTRSNKVLLSIALYLSQEII